MACWPHLIAGYVARRRSGSIGSPAQVIQLFNQFSIGASCAAPGAAAAGSKDAKPTATGPLEPVGELTSEQLVRFLNEVQVRSPPDVLHMRCAFRMLAALSGPRLTASVLRGATVAAIG